MTSQQHQTTGSNQPRSIRNSNTSLHNNNKKKIVADLFRSALRLEQEPEDPIPSPEEIEKLKRKRDQEIVEQAKITGGGGGGGVSIGVVIGLASTARIGLGL